MFLLIFGYIAVLLSLASAQDALDASCNLGAICYALDHSGTLNDTEYAKLQEFAINSAVILSNTVPPGVGTQYSAVGFSTETIQIVDPTTDVNGVFVPAITSFVDRSREFTDIYGGMRRCNQSLAQAATGVPKVLVVTTDGQHNAGGANPAQNIKDSGVTIVTIAVGSATRDQDLLEWSSGERYFFETTFADISDLANLFASRACSATNNGSSETQQDVAAEAQVEAEGSAQVQMVVANSMDAGSANPSNTPISVDILPMAVSTSTSAATAASATITNADGDNSALPAPVAPTSSNTPSPIVAIPPPSLSPFPSITSTPSTTRTPSPVPTKPLSSSERPSTTSSPLVLPVLPISLPFPVTPSVPSIPIAFPSASASKSLPKPSNTATSSPIDVAVLPLTVPISPTPSISGAASVMTTRTAAPSASISISSSPSSSKSAIVSSSPSMTSSMTATPSHSPPLSPIDIAVLPISVSVSPTASTSISISPSSSILTSSTATSSSSSTPSSSPVDIDVLPIGITVSPTASTTISVSPTSSSSPSASATSSSTPAVSIAAKITSSPSRTSSPTSSSTPSSTSTQSLQSSSPTRTPIVIDVLSAVRQNCEAAFNDCKFTFEGTDSLPTFTVPAPSPDVPFTPRIVSKDSRKFIGIVNTAKFPAQFIDGANVSRNLTDFGNPPFAPTAVKAELISSLASGIAHQYLEGDQIWEVADKCVRVYFDAYQLLFRGSKQVAGNLNFDQPEPGACVVFLTTA